MTWEGLRRETRRETRELRERQSDAVAGDLKTGRYGALRVTSTGQHANTAILRHGEQINDSNDSEESKGEKSRPFQDGSKGERKHDHKGNSSGETQRTRLMKSGRICSTLRRSSEAWECERARPTGRQPFSAPQNFST